MITMNDRMGRCFWPAFELRYVPLQRQDERLTFGAEPVVKQDTGCTTRL